MPILYLLYAYCSLAWWSPSLLWEVSISRVMSENEVKFDVVNLITSLCLESLIDQEILSICYPHLLIVKDRSESCILDETSV